MKKKIISVLLCTAMTATMLAGCGGSGEDTQAPAASGPEEEAPAASEPAAEEPAAQESAALLTRRRKSICLSLPLSMRMPSMSW